MHTCMKGAPCNKTNYVLTADDFEDISIPLGGDQLVRVRMQGSKGLRKGSHTRDQRLELLNPVMEELFHVAQDFLDVSIYCLMFVRMELMFVRD